jgi:hypothetical protein
LQHGFNFRADAAMAVLFGLRLFVRNPKVIAYRRTNRQRFGFCPYKVMGGSNAGLFAEV